MVCGTKAVEKSSVRSAGLIAEPSSAAVSSYCDVVFCIVAVDPNLVSAGDAVVCTDCSVVLSPVCPVVDLNVAAGDAVVRCGDGAVVCGGGVVSSGIAVVVSVCSDVVCCGGGFDFSISAVVCASSGRCGGADDSGCVPVEVASIDVVACCAPFLVDFDFLVDVEGFLVDIFGISVSLAVENSGRVESRKSRS